MPWAGGGSCGTGVGPASINERKYLEGSRKPCHGADVFLGETFLYFHVIEMNKIERVYI